MKALRNRRDILLLTLVLCMCVVLLISEFGISITIQSTTFELSPSPLNPAYSVLSSLSLSVIAAYIFYVFIELIPRAKRESETEHVLNSLLSSILDAYARCRLFGHETPISHVDLSYLEIDWLTKQEEILKKQQADFLPLKFATQTADSRLEDFRNALPLAMSLSPQHALSWLVIIDKVRLLAELYSQHPKTENDPYQTHDNGDQVYQDFATYQSGMSVRLLGIVETAKRWCEHSR